VVGHLSFTWPLPPSLTLPLKGGGDSLPDGGRGLPVDGGGLAGGGRKPRQR